MPGIMPLSLWLLLKERPSRYMKKVLNSLSCTYSEGMLLCMWLAQTNSTNLTYQPGSVSSDDPSHLAEGWLIRRGGFPGGVCKEWFPGLCVGGCRAD